jgi:predicted nucleic acid-binding protein
VVVEPTLRHLDLLAELLSEVGTAGNLVHDAHLAALALEHGCELVSYDADFARFPGVRWRAPG